MDMDYFLTNRIIANSGYLIALLVGLLVVLHLLLVWPRNLSLTSWKRCDYVWLLAASMSIFAAAAQIRMSIAATWAGYNRTSAEATLRTALGVVRGGASYASTQFVRSDSSPSNFDEIQAQFRLASQWYTSVTGVVDSIQVSDLPELSFDQFPAVPFKLGSLTENVDFLKQTLNRYKDERALFLRTRSRATQSKREEALAHLAPFLMCAALALRITKVTGELRHLHAGRKQKG